ncbi:hypothetical protein RUND412_003440 [Rhizina undulata]
MPSTLQPPSFSTSASSPNHTTHLRNRSSSQNQRNGISSGGGSRDGGIVIGVGVGVGGGGGGGGGISDSDDDDDLSSNSSTTSLPTGSSSQLHPSSFAPPFYNRPPTPLPPSPSLTSLLLPPPFTPSRPTTPDSSDSEAVATSSRIAQSSPRAAPKVPTYEYYGFVLYLISSLAFLIYIVWSYAPSSLLHAMGIHYYPNRWWSLALPSFLVMLVVYMYVALASYNTGYLTRRLEELECIVDDAAQVAAVFGLGSDEPGEKLADSPGAISPISPLDGGGGIPAVVAAPEKRERGKRRLTCSERWKGKELWEDGGGELKDWKALWSKGTDAVMDIPVGGVCEVLYGEDRELEDWELELEADGVASR